MKILARFQKLIFQQACQRNRCNIVRNHIYLNWAAQASCSLSGGVE